MASCPVSSEDIYKRLCLLVGIYSALKNKGFKICVAFDITI